jgi:hypothetical protein
LPFLLSCRPDERTATGGTLLLSLLSLPLGRILTGIVAPGKRGAQIGGMTNGTMRVRVDLLSTIEPEDDERSVGYRLGAWSGDLLEARAHTALAEAIAVFVADSAFRG